MNRIEPVLRAIEAADPDIFLLATQYSILHHADTARDVLPALAKRDIAMVVGAPLEAGYLGGRERYDYGGDVPAGMPDKRARITELAAKHGIDLRTAALQFAAAPDVVAAVIPGARTADQARSNVRSMTVAIPAEFWNALRSEKLIEATAPTPP